jgi:acyl-CoA thioester hydrolase
MKFDETEIRVRFHEVDSWGMVWHGHYIAWFEVGRSALLNKFQLSPQDFTRLGYIAPVVDLKCSYKEPARLGDEIILRTTVLKPTKAALTFQFEVLRKEDRRLLVTGEETQVLQALDGRLLYYIPSDLQKNLQNLFNYLGVPGSPV